jgi:Tol biopolymer transport system component/DNA-binding winged helix-turn-helix (wHTH) protein
LTTVQGETLVGDAGPLGSSGHGAYAFGSFVVDSFKRRLWRDGQLVPITAKTFDVLVMLIEHRDGVVTKDELLNRVWPNTVVQENNLARQISSLRRALGQRPDQHDYIVTIPGHGYRFVANVQGLAGVPLELQSPSEAQSQRPSERGTESLVPNRLVRELDADDSGHQTSSDRPGGPWISRASLIAASCALLLATGAVAALLLRSEPGRVETRRALQRVTYDEAGLPRDAAWAPDGRWLVYASDRAGNADLWKQRPGDPNPVRLTTSPFNESEPVWSPDGQSIAFRSERDGGGLYVTGANGGIERLVSRFGHEPRWSPDSTHILFRRSVVLPDLPTFYVVGLDGMPARPVRPDVLGQFRALQASWHPDGRRLSIWGTTLEGELKFLDVPMESGRATMPEIAPELRQDLASLSPGRFVWAPSRRFIYFEAGAGDSRNVWRVTVDPETERWIGGPDRLTTGAGEDTNVALSPDGARLVFTTTSNRTRLWAFPFDSARGRITGQPDPITDGSASEVDFDARADGSKVAYRAERAGRHELWERSIAEGQERLLLSSVHWKLVKPRWSPDGGQLAFSRYAERDHTLAVGVILADGSGERVLTEPGDVEMQAFDWSRDGEAILGACRFRQSERYSTCLVPVARAHNGDPSVVRVIASDPQRNLFNQRFSPDQRWITFLAHDLSYASTSTVYVAPTTGGPWRAITDGTWFDDKPRWGPDGRIVYFVSNRTGVANVWGRRFDNATGAPVGEAFPVTSFRSAQFVLTPRTVQMDIAITATHLLLPMSESRSEIWMLDQVDR